MARPVAGVVQNSLVITLPGSPKGARENLEAIVKLLPHACQQAAGANSRAMHAGGIAKLEKEAGLSSSSSSTTASSNMPTTAHSHSHHGHGHHSHSCGHHHHNGGGHHGPRAHTKPEDRPVIVSNDPSAGPTQRHRKSPYPMKSVDEALQLIRAQSTMLALKAGTFSAASTSAART